MISLRRSESRRQEGNSHETRWLTFFAGDDAEAHPEGFFDLQSLNEERLSPGGRSAPDPGAFAEVLTYVHEGSLVQRDPLGITGILRGDDFQRRGSGRSPGLEEANASRTAWVHLYRMWLRPSGDTSPSAPEQRRFSAAERRGGLTLVAAAEPRNGALRLHQDARLFSALLERGHHIIHELRPGRGAWLHVVEGAVKLGDVVLSAGDGVGVTTERALTFTAETTSEVFLVDLAERRSLVPSNGGSA